MRDCPRYDAPYGGALARGSVSRAADAATDLPPRDEACAFVRSRQSFIVLLTGLTLAMFASVGAQSAHSFSVGYFDEQFTVHDSTRASWLKRAATSGAGIVRLEIGWVAPNTPTRPAGFDARDPADPAYNFAIADAAIVDARAQGLRVLLSFTGAPLWAEGAGRPVNARPGSWRPDPPAVAEYGAALAQRYSGTFPDPARPGRALPRVDAYQVWNEPNLDKYLTPQWSGRRPSAPAHYRRMLNAFYHGVKAVRPTALVVSAGLAPYGSNADFAGGKRIRPARFVREMLCLRESRRRLRGTTCPEPARFDVFAHHPYSLGAPRRHAVNADDVSIPDIGRLTRLLRAAERFGGARPRKRHRLWVTEVSYQSSPPDANGVPLMRHARWLEETLYLLWRQGVDTVLWYVIRDHPVLKSKGTNQSGTFFRGGAPKPAARAFRFPLVAERVNRRSLRVWGRAPVAGSVRIQRRTGLAWRTVRTVRARRHATFLIRVVVKGRADLRARVGRETSLVWRGA